MDTTDQKQDKIPDKIDSAESEVLDPTMMGVLEAFGPVVNETGDSSVEASKAFVASFNNLGPQQRRETLEEIDRQSEAAGQVARNLTGSLDDRVKAGNPFTQSPPIDSEEIKYIPDNDLAAQRRKRNGLANSGTPPPVNQTAEGKNGFNRTLTPDRPSDPLNPAEVGEGDKRLLDEVNAKKDDSSGTVAADAVEVPVRFEPPPVIPKVEESAATVFNPVEKPSVEITAAEAKTATADTAPVAPAEPVVAEPPPPVTVAAEPPVAEPPPKRSMLRRALTAIGIINKPEINHTGDAFELHKKTVEERGNEIEKGEK